LFLMGRSLLHGDSPIGLCFGQSLTTGIITGFQRRLKLRCLAVTHIGQ
jgi:hypothetical protein